MMAKLRCVTVLRWAFAMLALVGCTLVAQVASAAQAQIKRIDPLISEGHLTMDLDVNLKLSPIVIEAAERGVPLYFTLDIKITAPRWWWWGSADCRDVSDPSHVLQHPDSAVARRNGGFVFTCRLISRSGGRLGKSSRLASGSAGSFRFEYAI